MQLLQLPMDGDRDGATSTTAGASASGAASSAASMVDTPVTGLLGIPRGVVAAGLENPGVLRNAEVVHNLLSLVERLQQSGGASEELSATVAALLHEDGAADSQ